MHYYAPRSSDRRPANDFVRDQWKRYQDPVINPDHKRFIRSEFRDRWSDPLARPASEHIQFLRANWLHFPYPCSSHPRSRIAGFLAI